MVQFDRRVLYNLLRMNWLLEPTTNVKPWQVEDYRKVSIDALFCRLKEKGIHLDKTSFLAYTEEYESPEDLTDSLIADFQFDVETQDEIYLILFELWRKLTSGKPCLSIFCDELDHQIYLYDSGSLTKPDSLHNILSRLHITLEEHADEGESPTELFECISKGCANDLESFLYDFIRELIDAGNYTYASELLDDFTEYVTEPKWFLLLKTLLSIKSGNEDVQPLIKEIMKIALAHPDLEFTFEALSLLVKEGDNITFATLVKQASSLLEIEDDFQDLLSLCADYYHCLDRDLQEIAIQNILKKRANIHSEKPIQRKDPDIAALLKTVSLA